jgi:hypothetical protein
MRTSKCTRGAERCLAERTCAPVLSTPLPPSAVGFGPWALAKLGPGDAPDDPRGRLGFSGLGYLEPGRRVISDLGPELVDPRDLDLGTREPHNSKAAASRGFTAWSSGLFRCRSCHRRRFQCLPGGKQTLDHLRHHRQTTLLRMMRIQVRLHSKQRLTQPRLLGRTRAVPVKTKQSKPRPQPLRKTLGRPAIQLR